MHKTFILTLLLPLQMLLSGFLESQSTTVRICAVSETNISVYMSREDLLPFDFTLHQVTFNIEEDRVRRGGDKIRTEWRLKEHGLILI